MEQLMFLEEAREIPVIGNVDVLVLGGGPAGVGAAVAAAREGAAVMLIEQTGDVGGVATSGMMSHWTGEAGADSMRKFWTGPAMCGKQTGVVRPTGRPSTRRG